MTPIRAGVSLAIIGLICLCVVVLRTERTRLEARTQEHQAQLVRLRRESWNLEMEQARLRSPMQIDRRVEWMDLQVRAPSQVDTLFPQDQFMYADSGR